MINHGDKMNIFFTTSNPRYYDLIGNWNSENNEHFVLWSYGLGGKFRNARVNDDYVFLVYNDSDGNHTNDTLFNCKIVDDKVKFSDKQAYLNNKFDKDFIRDRNYTDDKRFYKLKILGMTKNIKKDVIEENQNPKKPILDKNNNYCQTQKVLTKGEYLKCGLSQLLLKYSVELGLEEDEIVFLQNCVSTNGQVLDNIPSNVQVTENQTSRISKQKNLIVFGAPGTGKSYYLNTEITLFYKVERVTFYPSYSYSQFVGCYKPTMNGKDISYSFVPGPFLRTYVDAIKDPLKNYLLIIEEINRADAASVFGDVFQLLDRDKDGKSVYDISTSEDVKAYLKNEKVSNPDKICIPPNMFIWATMNSADQGVFPMDTAFKRRWDFLYFDLDGNPIEDNESCPVRKSNWEVIRKAINNWLCEKKVNEDKHLGKFFINVGDNVEEKDFRDAFKNKVLMYLYEDAARAFRSELFVKNNFSEILSDFNERGTDIFRPESIKSIAKSVDNVEERAIE